jgi:hypothetical protein
MVFGRSFFFFFFWNKLLTGDGRVIKLVEELLLMKETMTKDVIHWFMLQIYILTVITFLKRCFIIDQDTIGYVIDSVSAVEFQAYIFDIV